MAVIAACGGGGDPAPPPASGPITLSGTARFDAVPNTAGGSLDYGGTTQKPIRGATVHLLDGANQTLATTTTDAQGQYRFTMAAPQAVQVRVRAELKAASGQWDFTVRDNTNGDALYTLDSGAFMPTASMTRDLRAASGWGGASYTGARAAGPFALLDVVYQAQQKVVTTAAAQTLAPLKVFWSVNNRPVDGDRALGQVGTSFYTRVGTEHVLYILGDDDTDTDEYDSHVVAHEFGHYLAAVVSRDDSVGGSHTRNDKLDMRVAFSEGYANAWSGMLLGSPVYADSGGPAQASGFTLDVSVPATGMDRGWYSETTVQYLMWSAHQDTGFAPIFGALQAIRTSPALSSWYNFASALKAAAPAAAAGLDARAQSMQVLGTDAFGTAETNDGGNAANLPVYKTHAAPVGSAQTYCPRADGPTEGNKLGNHVFVRVTLANPASRITLTRSASNAATTDPDFLLVLANGSKQVADSIVPNAETLDVALSAGTHVIALEDFNLAAAGQSCLDLRVD